MSAKYPKVMVPDHFDPPEDVSDRREEILKALKKKKPTKRKSAVKEEEDRKADMAEIENQPIKVASCSVVSPIVSELNNIFRHHMKKYAEDIANMDEMKKTRKSDMRTALMSGLTSGTGGGLAAAGTIAEVAKASDTMGKETMKKGVKAYNAARRSGKISDNMHKAIQKLAPGLKSFGSEAGEVLVDIASGKKPKGSLISMPAKNLISSGLKAGAVIGAPTALASYGILRASRRGKLKRKLEEKGE